MRIFIKGGVWKNTEDEILKVAVMKYGKTKWSRVASLLPKKSAKQCKARWFEWLDPSIKKTEWTREEEEKLLHMAKLMPTQWRTIAPIVGRTAAQCLAHYEKLLDRAEGDAGEEKDPRDDPRRLRPGEIDPNPESKPAKPDPTDMDEDELEMLSEARARLANTKGKKAKRRAREKHMIEAKRLATLQKRRELRAAGILDDRKGPRKRSRKERAQIDYANEIPFYKKAPAGFHAVGDENRRVEKERAEETDKKFIARRQADLELKSRSDLERKRKREESKKARDLARDNLPEHIRRTEAALGADAMPFKRSKLSLPKPQVTASDLEKIVKLGSRSGEVSDHVVNDRASTNALMFDDYGNEVAEALDNASKLRTPLTTTASGASGRSAFILEEARNAVLRTNTTTPLLGGENSDMSTVRGGTGFKGGVEPMTPSSVTPSILNHGDASATPGTFASATPVIGGSDRLSINNGGTSSRHETANMASTSRTKRTAISSLRSGFGRLPEPQFEYGVALPEALAEDEDEENVSRASSTTAMLEDAGELELRRIKAQEARERERLRKRSAVLKRNLPRPYAPSRDMLEEVDSINGIIAKEALRLMKYDAAKFPVRKHKKEKRVPLLDNVTAAELKEANAMIRREAERSATACDYDRFVEAWDRAISNIDKNPNATDAEASARTLQATKMQKRLDIKLGGYLKVNARLNERLGKIFDATEDTRHKTQAFMRLMFAEERALPQRLNRLRSMLEAETRRECDLQQKFKALEREYRALWTERRI